MSAKVCEEDLESKRDVAFSVGALKDATHQWNMAIFDVTDPVITLREELNETAAEVVDLKKAHLALSKTCTNFLTSLSGLVGEKVVQ